MFLEICNLLQGCSKKKDLVAGRRVHSLILIHGFESAAILADNLIRMFTFCGSLLEASLVFCKVAKPSVYTWQAIISAHATHGKGDTALQLYAKMKHEGIIPNRFIFQCILRACRSIHASELGKRIHNEIITRGYDLDLNVASTLIDMYGKCGSLLEAHQVFDRLQCRNIISWGVMMTAYAQHGYGHHTLKLFERMQQDDMKPDRVIFLSLLKACGSIGDLNYGMQIHDRIIRSGLVSDVVVGSSLVDMYGKCGSLDDACKIFNALQSRDVVLWGALISGYTKHGHGNTALELFGKMQEEGIKPTKGLFPCILKACGNAGALGQGMLLHRQIIKNGLASDVFIGITLIDMYTKCGSLEKAHDVFNTLQIRDVVAWSSMIAGYAQQGHCLIALQLFKNMQEEGIQANEFIFSCILKACNHIEGIGLGKLIHNQIVKHAFESDMVIGGALIDMYAQCGCLQEAWAVLERLQNRNVVSWGAMLAGYAKHCHGVCALETFDKMQKDDIQPNKVIMLHMLKACSSIGALEPSELIHDQIIRKGFESDVMVGNALLDMYYKCGSLEMAYKVFHNLSSRDCVSWGLMIEGYAATGQSDLALNLFAKMLDEGIEANKSTCSYVLRACSGIRGLGQGKLVHDRIIRMGLESDVVIGNVLVDMYGVCGSLQEAHTIFEKLPSRDVVSWSSIIAAYAQNNLELPAFELYERMQHEGMAPNKVTFLSILKACGTVRQLPQVKLLHHEIIKSGFEVDKKLGDTLVEVYAKCGDLDEAWKIFDELPIRDAVSWVVMIAGYTRNGIDCTVLEIFREMVSEGIEPNEFIFPCILKACSCLRAIEIGKLIHEQIIRSGTESDAVVGSSLINMYATFGSLEEAQNVFDELPDRNVVSWGTMLAGCAQHGHDLSALKLFKEMQQEGIEPNRFTILGILKACGSIGALEQGKLVHDHIFKRGLELDVVIGSSLIHMYAKCGCPEEAHRLSAKLPSQDAVSLSVMIACHAQHRDDYMLAVQCLEDMQHEGMKPDGMIYSTILSVFSHMGQLQEGCQCFTSMAEVYGINPSIEHFNCMVAVLGYAGYLEEAVQLLQAMPIVPDVIGWLSLLSACRTYGNVDLGRLCFYRVIQLDPTIAAGHAIMTSIYASNHIWDDILKLQKLKISTGVWKRPGMAWVQVIDSMHLFIVGDKTHPQSDEIHATIKQLSRLMIKQGYVPQLDSVPERQVFVH